MKKKNLLCVFLSAFLLNACVINVPMVHATTIVSTDEQLMKEDNWLNQYVAEISKKQISELTLTDFKAITYISCLQKDNNIPESIKFCTNLTKIDLQNVDLSTIPLEFNQFTKLEAITLGNVEYIPDYLNSFNKLNSLALYDLNNKSTILNLNLSPNIKSFSLCNENDGQVDEEIFNLNYVNTLNLLYTNLKEIPERIIDIPNLKNLYVSSKELEVIPDTIFSSNKLEGFGCCSDKLSTLPNSIPQNSSLKELSITGFPNKYTIEANENIKEIPDSFKNLNLETLSLGLTINEVPKELLKPSLTKLALIMPNITKIPDEIMNTNLETLNLIDCSNLTRLPENIGDLPQFKGIFAVNTPLVKVPDSIYNTSILFEGVNVCITEFSPMTNNNILFMGLFAPFMGIPEIDQMFCHQLELSKTDLNINVNDKVNIGDLVKREYPCMFLQCSDREEVFNPNLTLGDNVFNEMTIVPEDTSFFDENGVALKSGTTKFRIKFKDNPDGNTYGITDYVTVNIKDVSESEDLTVTFNQQDTIELTLSSNTVNFGNSDLVDIEKDLIATVKSSLPYNLYITALDDFKNTDNDVIPISKLSVKEGTSTYKNFTVGNEMLLASSPAKLLNTHNITLKLAESIGYKSGDYSTSLEVRVVQE